MRITCPGCESVFDVPDRAVPDPGRDVQCAACGTSWYLLKSGGPLPGGASQPARPMDRPGTSAGTGTPEAVPVGRSPLPDPAPVERDPPAQRRVPPEVLAILRAEAETERRARQRAATGAVSGAATGTASGAVSGDSMDDRPPRMPTAGTPADTMPDAHRSRQAGPSDARQRGGAGLAHDRAAHPRRGAGSGAETTGLDARDRLARLTAAERRPSATGGSGGVTAPMGTRDGEEDHGLVEDPDAAVRAPRPPLLGGQQPGPAPVPAMATSAPLPVNVAADPGRALVVLQAKRRGFGLGFGVTLGLCCGALALYLVALNTGDREGGVVFDAVRSHGAQVQAALVDWLRRVVVPALS